MSTYTGPSAFPSPDVYDASGCGISQGSPGMDLRDWFAGQALAGLCANPSIIDGGSDAQVRSAAWCANQIAGAMLAERAKIGTPA